MIEIPQNAVYSIKALTSSLDTGQPEDATAPSYKFFGPGNAASVASGALADHTASGEEGFAYADVALTEAAGFVVGSMYTLVIYAVIGGTNIRLKLVEFLVSAPRRTAGLPEVNVAKQNNATVYGTGAPVDKWRGTL